jgi:hypothetical protein
LSACVTTERIFNRNADLSDIAQAILRIAVEVLHNARITSRLLANYRCKGVDRYGLAPKD